MKAKARRKEGSRKESKITEGKRRGETKERERWKDGDRREGMKKYEEEGR